MMSRSFCPAAVAEVASPERREEPLNSSAVRPAWPTWRYTVSAAQPTGKSITSSYLVSHVCQVGMYTFCVQHNFRSFQILLRFSWPLTLLQGGCTYAIPLLRFPSPSSFGPFRFFNLRNREPRPHCSEKVFPSECSAAPSRPTCDESGS